MVYFAQNIWCIDCLLDNHQTILYIFRVASVLDQMRSTYHLLRRKFKKVSRIHVHTLAFQAIMTRKGSAWKNTMSAAAHASLTANRHVCGTKVVDVDKVTTFLYQAAMPNSWLRSVSVLSISPSKKKIFFFSPSCSWTSHSPKRWRMDQPKCPSNQNALYHVGKRT